MIYLSPEEFDDIFSSVHNCIIAVDKNGLICMYSRSCSKVFGYTAEEALGKPVSNIIPNTGLLEVLMKGEQHIGRKFYVGNFLYATNRTPVIKNNEIIGAVGVLQDITELKQIIEEFEMVKELKSTLESILDSGNEGYAVINKKDTITMINNAFAEIINLAPEKAVGKNINEFIESKKELINNIKPGLDLKIINFLGREVIVARQSIVKDGKSNGSIWKILFKDKSELVDLAEKINILNKELTYYKSELKKAYGVKYTFDSIKGNSPVMKNLKQTAQRVARGPSTILIRGESGTGKEMLAHAIHAASEKCKGPFIKINCASLPESLLESELFGYQEGAFTGAKKGGKKGKFEQADGGTIFLDEIGNMSLAMQSKLLRVLQEKEIERLGDSKTRRVKVRIIAATNSNLESMIEKGLFRNDLFFRLNVISLVIPPLRNRMEDLDILIKHFFDKYNEEFKKNVYDIEPGVKEFFESYKWPGNIRELENIIEQAFNVVNGPIIKIEHLPAYLKQKMYMRVNKKGMKLKDILMSAEKNALINALHASGGNKRKAALSLGISRAWLYKKLYKYGIEY